MSRAEQGPTREREGEAGQDPREVCSRGAGDESRELTELDEVEWRGEEDLGGARREADHRRLELGGRADVAVAHVEVDPVVEEAVVDHGLGRRADHGGREGAVEAVDDAQVGELAEVVEEALAVDLHLRDRGLDRRRDRLLNAGVHHTANG